VFIHIPRNLVLDKPIHFLSCLSDDGISTISRNVIFADESSKATIVQELYSPKTKPQQAYLELLNTNLAANAHLDITTLQMMDQNTVNFSTRRTDLAQDAKVNWYSGLFGAMLSRYKIDYFLKGSGASVNDSEVIFGNNEQSFDIQTNVGTVSNAQPVSDGKLNFSLKLPMRQAGKVTLDLESLDGFTKGSYDLKVEHMCPSLKLGSSRLSTTDDIDDPLCREPGQGVKPTWRVRRRVQSEKQRPVDLFHLIHHPSAALRGDRRFHSHPRGSRHLSPLRLRRVFP